VALILANRRALSFDPKFQRQLLNDRRKAAPSRSELQSPQIPFIAALYKTGMKQQFPPANDNEVEWTSPETFPDEWWASP
jgi:hypothetical protein